MLARALIPARIVAMPRDATLTGPPVNAPAIYCKKKMGDLYILTERNSQVWLMYIK